MEDEHVYVLHGYDWNRARVLSRRKKTVRVWVHPPFLVPHERSVPLDKIAAPDERVCIVWDNKKPRGRGTYRVERDLYAEWRIPACEVARQTSGPGRVTERLDENGAECATVWKPFELSGGERNG